MKKFISIILVAFITISIAACGSSSKSLVGKWEKNESKTRTEFGEGMFSTMEFFSNGTYTTGNGLSGGYTVENNRIKISSDSGFSDRVYNYKITGNTLTLDDDKGRNHIEYQKVK